MRVSGTGGELRYKYRTAAVLGAWVVSSDIPSYFHITASVETLVTPWCDRVPLDLHLNISTNRWVWELLDKWRKESDDMAVEVEIGRLPTVIIGGSKNGKSVDR
jgi:hypothetical protein